MPRNRLLLWPSILCFVPALWQNTPTRLDRSDESDFTISTDIELVILDVSVKDAKGGYVSGLGKEDFRVYENNQPQPITHFSHADIPVSVGLVIDNSGSMLAKRAEVVTAALTFVQASNPLDEMFVVNFNDKVHSGLPADVPFTDDTKMLRAALWKGESVGRTSLYDALAYALKHLEKGRKDKKTLVLVSDGGDNASAIGLTEILRRTAESRATIYTIGLFDENDLDRKPSVLRKLANVSGGEYFQLRQIDDVAPVCRKIAGDIRNRYTIAYTPRHLDSRQSERLIKVTASDQSRSRLIVRTRSRYIMPESTSRIPEPKENRP
jgi:Ca-activated chloride channel homolog